jgi:defect-in-organelle-trafficking protein DotB
MIVENLPLFPDEPIPGGWADPDVMQQFVRWAGGLNASDIKMVPTGPVSIRVDGEYYAVTKNAPGRHEMAALLEEMSNDRAAASSVFGGSVVNFGYRVPLVRRDRRSGFWRLRGVATSAAGSNDETGMSITLRFIRGVIPDIDELGISKDLMDKFIVRHGLVSVSGVMGSGKTTTLAAVMQRVLQTRRDALMSLESPIEFDYSNIPGRIGIVEQCEVPRMISSFDKGIVSATRKAVDVLMVGETNDRATMEALVKAAEVGIAVYHTLHTSSVAAIPSRIIHNFTPEEAPGIAVSFCGSAHFLIQQRLYPRVGGGRVALREWLSLNEDHRQRLINTPHEKLFSALEVMVQEDGHSLLKDAAEVAEKGWISEDTYHTICVEKERTLSGGH